MIVRGAGANISCFQSFVLNDLENVVERCLVTRFRSYYNEECFFEFFNFVDCLDPCLYSIAVHFDYIYNRKWTEDYPLQRYVFWPFLFKGALVRSWQFKLGFYEVFAVESLMRFCAFEVNYDHRINSIFLTRVGLFLPHLIKPFKDFNIISAESFIFIYLSNILFRGLIIKTKYPELVCVTVKQICRKNSTPLVRNFDIFACNSYQPTNRLSTNGLLLNDKSNHVNNILNSVYADTYFRNIYLLY